ncbi:MAG: hypothetical protein WD226_09050 [Planctomycetota bacterium]
MRALALVSACLATLALPLAAQRAEVVMPDVGLRVEASMNWPQHCSKGYVPVRMRVENESASPKSVEVTLGRFRDSSSTSRSLAAPPGVSDFTLLFPAFQREGYARSRGMQTVALQLTVRQGLRQAAAWDAGSHLLASEEPVRCYVVLTSSSVTTGKVDDWSRSVGHERTYAGGSYLTASGAAVAFDEAPLRFEAYTSLDAVVVDTASGLPTEDVLAAVLRYARLGGSVVFLGPAATKLVEARPDVGRFEARFLGRAEPVPEASVVAYGLGLLATLDTEATLLEDAASRALLTWALEKHPTPAPPQPLIADPNAAGAGPPPDDLDRGPYISGLQRVPYRTMLLGLALFALLIGPVNFLVLRRIQRPMLLTLTIPAIALVASLIILGTGFWTAGIDNRTAEYGYTVLDQRAHRASTVLLRSLWCGLSPSALRPGDGSALLPEQIWSEGGAALGYQLDEDDGLVLTGDFLPVRRSEKQTLFADRTFRGRVLLEPSDGTWRATNGLGVELDVFVFCDGDGRCHRLEGTLADGATATLQPIERASSARSTWQTFAERLRQVGYPDLPAMVAGRAIDDELRAEYARLLESFELPRGAYLALFDEANPAVDDMGLATRVAFARHVILGLVDVGSRR